MKPTDSYIETCFIKVNCFNNSINCESYNFNFWKFSSLVESFQLVVTNSGSWSTSQTGIHFTQLWPFPFWSSFKIRFPQIAGPNSFRFNSCSFFQMPTQENIWYVRCSHCWQKLEKMKIFSVLSVFWILCHNCRFGSFQKTAGLFDLKLDRINDVYHRAAVMTLLKVKSFSFKDLLNIEDTLKTGLT